ncbi:antitoxin [Chromatium okenii]|uniref:AbrB/MazE/SpoVT family DNA-binding domain-containing protein n=1 Tax=Chromatium okenii TaxID=61644 RepID=UPI0019068269|nr:antitoxin [Chromatium okenii]MBK1641246.1 antitoxin [Chromatium okenii]
MHTTNLRKVGGSVMLAVPPTILNLLHLQIGTTLSLAIDHGRLIIEPLHPGYRLDDLLAQCDTTAEMSTEEKVWLENSPIGRELL